MNIFKNLRLRPFLRACAAGLVLTACHKVATATSINFENDPFAGLTVRNTPGRQIVGGEFFISFHTATEQFIFDEAAFGINDLRFANGTTNTIPSNANVIVLQTTDNDDNPLTPFGAGNAADLIATRVTTSGPGLFIYFNSGLTLPRLVYSDDLSSNTADLRILARMLSLNNQTGLDSVGQLPAFSAENFQLRETAAVPEPSSMQLIGAGVAMLGIAAFRRRASEGSDEI